MALNVFGKHPSMTLQMMSILVLYVSVIAVFVVQFICVWLPPIV